MYFITLLCLALSVASTTLLASIECIKSSNLDAFSGAFNLWLKSGQLNLNDLQTLKLNLLNVKIVNPFNVKKESPALSRWTNQRVFEHLNTYINPDSSALLLVTENFIDTHVLESENRKLQIKTTASRGSPVRLNFGYYPMERQQHGG